jgi:hypothetical protein
MKKISFSLLKIIGVLLFGSLLICATFIIKDCSWASSLPANYIAETSTMTDSLDGHWFLEIFTNDVGYVRTVLHITTSDGKFEGHSREGVSSKLLGWWKNFLGKLFTSDFENGALVHLKDGTFTKHTDGSTAFKANFASALGRYEVNGNISNGKLSASLSNQGKVVGRIYGTKNIPALPLENYSALTAKIIQTAEANIYDDKVVHKSEWESFKQELHDFSAVATDDIEYMFAFFYRSRSLPFSHFNLFQKHEDTLSASDSKTLVKKSIYTKDLSDSVSYLRISSFAGTSEELDLVFDTIITRNKKYLIIDLRGNPGGNISAMSVISHIIDTEHWGGVFVTRKWFAGHSTPPSIGDYQKFPLLDEANLSLLFAGIHDYDGLCIKVKPDPKQYSGKVTVLVDKNTASSCEPLVYGFKEYKLGKIIGEHTAGAMLNGEEFPIKDFWTIVIPTAEYYTADGFRIDKVGIEPDLTTSSKEALNKALNNLGK